MVRSSSRQSMLNSSLGLILGKIAQMGLGFLFWVLATKLASTEQVGLAAGAVSAVMLCTQLALLGMGAAFILNYPRNDNPLTALNSGVTVNVVAASLLSAVALLLMRHLSEEYHGLSASLSFSLIFPLVVVLGTVALLFDHVSMALGLGYQVLRRNIVGGVMVLALISGFWLTAIQGDGVEESLAARDLFSLWAIGTFAVFAYGIMQLRRTLSYRVRLGWQNEIARSMLRVGAPNHLLTLGERTPGLLVPVLVTEVVSLSANAHWYLIWMMAWAVYLTPISVGIGLFAESAHRPESAGPSTRRAIWWSLAVGGVGASLLALLADPVLALLGADYATAGAMPLRVLLLAVLPITVTQAYFAGCRSRGKPNQATAVAVVAAIVACSGMPLAGMHWGLMGMAVTWLVVQLAVGSWALWRLRRMTRPDAVARLGQPLHVVP